MRFEHSPSFPETDANRELLERATTRLAEHVDVALFGLPQGEADFGAECAHPIHALARPTAGEALEVETAAIASARGVVAPFGLATHLAVSYGVPAVALYSDHGQIDQNQLDVALRAARETGGSLTLVRDTDFEFFSALVAQPNGWSQLLEERQEVSDRHK